MDLVPLTALRSAVLVKHALASAVVLSALALGGCAASTHAVEPAKLGQSSRSGKLLEVIDQPGPIEAETVVSTAWAVSRAGLINLDNPTAKAAGLIDGDEPIEIYFHVIRHPDKGVFLIDTGVEKALRDSPEKAAIQGLVAKEMHVEKMGFKKPLADFLAEQKKPVSGVFFTHLHLDHASGAPDLPKSTPIYAGPGETSARAFLNMFTQGTADRQLDGLPTLGEWKFSPDPDGLFEGVLDVFGDGSFWALYTPGHTPGSTSYLARTAQGPILFVGDTCHTRWGWEAEVEPGGYTADHAKNRESLLKLRRLVREHPKIQVRLGHQPIERVMLPRADK
ncbi:MAG: MBL fold metallo-hydrolase [Byssovorax sp.]